MWRLKKKIFRAVVSKHALRRAKIWLPNSDFHEFFCTEQLIHSKKTCKKVFTYRVWRKSLDPFFSFSLLVSFSVCPTYVRIFDFRKNLEILSVHFSGTMCKIRCFYLYVFWRYKALVFPPQSQKHQHIHMHKSIFKKKFLLVSRDLKT